MDGISAISFTASIASLVDLCCNIVRGSYEIYRSELGSPRGHAQIGTVLDDLDNVAKTLTTNFVKSDSTHSEPLRKLARDCLAASTELSDVLNDIRRKEGNRVWRSLEAKWKSMRKEGVLAALEQRLDFLRLELLLRLNLVISEEQSLVKSKLESIENDNFHSSIRTENEIRAVQEAIGNLEGRLLSALSFDASRVNGDDTLALVRTDLTEVLRALEVIPKAPTTEEIVLRRLHFPTANTRMESIVDAEFGTFEWLLESDGISKQGDKKLTEARQSFLQWLENDDDKVYHISGKAGSGKSTLMKYLCQHSRLQTTLSRWAGDKKLVFASYFFWNSGQVEQKTLGGLYRSLLLDTLKQCPELIKEAFPQCWVDETPHCVEGIHAPFSISELKQAAEVVFRKPRLPNHRFCFFIDGLDEFDADLHTDHWDLARLLRNWTANSLDVKICVSSRPHEEFLQCFDPSSRIHLHQLTHGDVERFVCGALERGAIHATNTVSLDIEKVAKDIAERAEGVFLWVRLVVRSLVNGIRHRYSSTMLKDRLDKIPRGLEALFDQLFSDIDPSDRDRSDMVFLLVASGDVKDALMYSWLDDLFDPEFPYNLPSRVYSDAEILSLQETVRSQLANLTKGLVEMNPRFPSVDLAAARGWECDIMGLRDVYFGQRVDFFHRTVQDYLNDPGRLAVAKHRLKGRFNIADAIPRLRLALFKFARTMPCYFRPQGLGQTALIECFETLFDEKYLTGSTPRFLDECESALDHHRQTPFTYHEVAGQEHPGIVAWGQGWNNCASGEALTGDDLSYLHWLVSYRNRSFDDYVMQRLLSEPRDLLSRHGPSLLFASSSSYLQRGRLDIHPEESLPFRLLAAGVSPNGEIDVKYSPDEDDSSSSHDKPDHAASWPRGVTTMWTAFIFLVAETNMNDFRFVQDYMRKRSPQVFLLVEELLRHGADPDVSFDLELSRDEAREWGRDQLSVTLEDIVMYIGPPHQEKVLEMVHAGQKGKGSWLWQAFGAKTERELKYRRGRIDEFNTEERGYRVKTAYARERVLEGNFFVNLW
ncbi:hypothetical protein B0T14DRAFT_608152 [Immersiella caudata]|uniref:NACHT domain-containing protein n=1 Tax=Immersiella caudata TaxID=314043 RepID=A0AA39T253_9PEZI|nr:hypothetical protein B0T14DRAFT_608152 [Immersiella caudata]